MEKPKYESFRGDLESVTDALKIVDKEKMIPSVKQYMNHVIIAFCGAYSYVQRECIKLLSEILACSGELKWERRKCAGHSLSVPIWKAHLSASILKVLRIPNTY